MKDHFENTMERFQKEEKKAKKRMLLFISDIIFIAQATSKKDIISIIERQMEEEKKMELADEILVNDGTSLLVPQILAIHNQIMAGNC